MLDRTEFLGDRDGRRYQISTEDERIFTWHEGYGKSLDAHELERIKDDALDDFEDGYNRLVEIDGVMYEMLYSYGYEIIRRAYNIEG